jgi:hypothetical protein
MKYNPKPSFTKKEFVERMERWGVKMRWVVLLMSDRCAPYNCVLVVLVLMRDPSRGCGSTCQTVVQ